MCIIRQFRAEFQPRLDDGARSEAGNGGLEAGGDGGGGPRVAERERDLVDTVRRQGEQRLERADGEEGGTGVEREHAGMEDAAHGEEVVADGAVGGGGDEDDLGAGADVELAGHLVADRDVASAAGGGSAADDGGEEAGDARLASEVDAEQDGGGRFVAGADEAAAVDARCGGDDGGVGAQGVEKGVDVGALVSAEGGVEVALGEEVGGVDLDLRGEEAGAVLDHLGDDTVGEGDDEDGGEEAEGEGAGGDEGASGVAPEVAPGDAPPDAAHGRQLPLRLRREKNDGCSPTSKARSS